MKSKADRITDLCDSFSALLEREQKSSQELISSLIEYVGTIQHDTADRRWQQIITQLKLIQERNDLLAEMARRDFLSKIEQEAKEIKHTMADRRIARVLEILARVDQPSLSSFCETLLDCLIELTGGQRGFILSYVPESSEADVLAARNFQTTNLSLEEYAFSRTLLHDILERGESLLIDDATNDPQHSRVVSVRRFSLKSVLAAPLKQGDRTVGVLYLENNIHACAFTEEDRQFLNSVAQLFIVYLSHARLLPIVFEPERRVFLDADKASREIVGRDAKILAVLDVVNRIADSPATVLIEGESGTGKELVARALHYESRRRDRPFVAINCAAIPENLLESELFGHEKGSFTGATEKRIGLIEQAAGGTIFLDEVSELAYALQPKLLRFLQLNEFRRVGGKELIQADVRAVAATSKDLKDFAAAGKFHDALFYRLNVIPVRMPSLRERKQDIPLLIEHFLRKYSTLYGKSFTLEPQVYDWLKECPFPGNVRELENLIHRLTALAVDNQITAGDLPREFLQIPSHRISLEKDPLYLILHTAPTDLDDLKTRRAMIKDVLADQERQLAERALQATDGNLTEAA
ncbi:MAG: sigma-54-dependent Fis family transcriptional regulator, partial [Pyrinomonadaceae bacterium]